MGIVFSIARGSTHARAQEPIEFFLDQVTMQPAVEELKVQHVPDLEGLIGPRRAPSLGPLGVGIEVSDGLIGLIEVLRSEVIVIIDDPDFIERVGCSIGMPDGRSDQARGVLTFASYDDMDLAIDVKRAKLYLLSVRVSSRSASSEPNKGIAPYLPRR